MPIYEYTCKQCGNFEVMQRISETPLKKCPTCGAKVSKLISLSAFHLKGSGWYATDYAKNGSSKTDDTKPATNAKETSASPSAASTKESAGKESASTP
jgi:putative FmdB family regulatory protein